MNAMKWSRFLQKLRNLVSKIGKMWQLCCRMRVKYYFLKVFFFLFHLRFSCKRIRKFLNSEELENVMKIVFLETLSSFWKASLTKLVGEKYPGGSRQFCWYFCHWTKKTFVVIQN